MRYCGHRSIETYVCRTALAFYSLDTARALFNRKFESRDMPSREHEGMRVMGDGEANNVEIVYVEPLRA